MRNEPENILGLPPANLIAVLADAVIIAFISRSLLTDNIVLFPALILVAACASAALNAVLILLGQKMQRQTFLSLRSIAMAGNIGLLVVLGLAGLLALALLGSGGAGGLIETGIYFVAVAATIVLNMKLVADTEAPRT